MTGFSEILGQDANIELLGRMAAGERLAHALVFRGPEGVGKRTIAVAFATILLCSRGSDGEPCGDCDDCRQLAAGHHPDFLLVTRLPKPKRSSRTPDELRSVIGVDQIREMSRLAALAPRRGVRRVFVIDPADRLNPEAQNALLKTLEEPPGHAVILLIASRPHLLLPTVRSRALPLAFPAMRPVDLAAALQARGFERDEALARAALADGRPGRALELDLEEHRERRTELLEMLERLNGSPESLAELPALAARLAGKTEDSLVASLELVQTLLRDAGRAAMRPDDPALIHVDIATRLSALGQRIGEERAIALTRSSELLRGQLRFNVNRTLVAESLLAAVAGGPLPDA